MACSAAGLIVVIDASTFVSAALKADSLSARALLRAVDPPNRSQEVEEEYRGVIFRSKFDCFVTAGAIMDPERRLHCRGHPTRSQQTPT
jgi:hypothetical protein